MERVGIRVSNLMVEAYKRILIEKKKVATRTTIKSLKAGHRLRKDGVTAYVSADKGLFFIQSGRRPGGKLPMRKTGGQWRLVERLEKWKRAVNFGGPDFLLARSIARKGVKGVDITGMVLEEERANIAHEIAQAATEDIKDVTVRELRNAFKNF